MRSQIFGELKVGPSCCGCKNVPAKWMLTSTAGHALSPCHSRAIHLQFSDNNVMALRLHDVLSEAQPICSSHGVYMGQWQFCREWCMREGHAQCLGLLLTQAQGLVTDLQSASRNAHRLGLVRAVLAASLYPSFGQVLENKQRHCRLQIATREKVGPRPTACLGPYKQGLSYLLALVRIKCLSPASVPCAGLHCKGMPLEMKSTAHRWMSTFLHQF